MATPILMPRQGQSVESCILVEWLVQPGDTIEAGQAVANIETDKAVFEVEAPEAGTLLERFFDEGEDIAVLTHIAALGEPGEDASALRPQGASEPESTAPSPAPVAEVAAPALSGGSAPAPTGSTGVSPRARGLAARTGVAAAALAGSGPGGRVIERDVQAAAAAAPVPVPASPAGSDVGEPVTGIRKLIGERMMASLGTAAQYTVTRRFNATLIQGYRARAKAGAEARGLPAITLNDMILFTLSRVLKRHPDLNAHCLGDRIVRFPQVDIGVAVDTPRGLMVPVLKGANTLSLSDISQAVRPLATACQEGTIQPDLLSGSTITVSNLGALGIEAFTPVLNVPEVAILGVGGIVLNPVQLEDGSIGHAPTITLSLTADHRAVDGAPAARFLKDLCEALEDFEMLLAL